MSPPRRRRNADEEPLLFDLPLAPPTAPARSPGRSKREPLQPDLFPAAPEPGAAATAEDPEPPALDFGAEPLAEAPPAGPVLAGVGIRLQAGTADLLLHLGALAAAYLGVIALGVEPRLSHWPAFATLVLTFSFLQTVVSLAFWGQTAGMAWRGLHSRDRLQRPLTFRQATLRWAGGLVTLAAAGLPLLLALRGTSLADWISRSVTYAPATAPSPPA